MNKNVLSTILPLNYLKIPKNLARTWQDESVSVRAGAIKQNESDRSRTHSRSVLSCSVPASRDFVTSFLNFGLLSSVFCLPSS